MRFADEFCEMVGVGPFVDPSWTPVTKALRLFLWPAFGAAVLIELEVAAEAAFLSVISQQSCRESESSLESVSTIDDSCELTRDAGASILDEFLAVRFELPNYQARDGICVMAAWSTPEGAKTFDFENKGDAVAELVDRTIETAWNSLEDPRVRNRLRDCALSLSSYLPSRLPGGTKRASYELLAIPDTD